jgi:hypothetical protein
MKLTAWIAALALSFTIGLNLRPPPTTTYETIVRTETVHQASTADQLADVLIRVGNLNPDLDLTLAYECIIALVRQTGEDLAPVIAYIERRYQGDSCAALAHYQTEGYY